MEREFETKLAVDGMTCMSCVRHVTGALREVSDVKDVEVDLRGGRVVVHHGGADSAQFLVAALAAAGYPARIAS